MNMVRPNIRCYANSEALIEAAATLIAERVKMYIEQQGRCRLALAGGRTPRPVYERLAGNDLTHAIDWRRVHVFWGDERCVPPDDDASNYVMAKSALLSHVGIIDSNVHRIEVERGPIAAAHRYAEVLGDEPLDLVLLGMGSDGHTASLFPNAADLDTLERVVPAYGHIAPLDRVSVSLRQINEAREVLVLISGADKAERLAEVLQEIESGRPELPAARVQPRSGLLVWLSDTAAAQNLAISNH